MTNDSLNDMPRSLEERVARIEKWIDFWETIETGWNTGRTTEPVMSWLPMKDAPTDGRRIALRINDSEYHGWYELNFGCWMGMDADWNLLELKPTGWKAL